MRGLLDTECEFLVEVVRLRIRHFPKEVVELGRHPVVVVADLPANVPEVNQKAEGVTVAWVSPVMSARSCLAAAEK